MPGLYGRHWRRRIELLAPEEPEAAEIDEVIFSELIHGGATEGGVATVQRAVDGLTRRGADAVLLACTDLTLLASRLRFDRPLLDTTVLHARPPIGRGRRTATESPVPVPKFRVIYAESGARTGGRRLSSRWSC